MDTVPQKLAVLSKRQTIGSVSIAVILYMIYRYRKLVRWQKQATQICPGPVCHPLLGNIRELIAAHGFSEQFFVNLHAEHGDVARFFLGPSIMNVSISNPDLIHELYRHARERPLETYIFLWYLGDENLMFQRGKMVKDMRLRYGEMVSQRSQLDKLHEKSMRMFRGEVEKWTSLPGALARPVDLHAALGPAIYDVMGETLFDAPWMSTEEGREIYRLHKKLIAETNRWVLWPVGPIFHPAFVDYLLSMRKWRNMLGNLLDKRAKEMRDNPKKFENDRSAMHMILTSKADDGSPFFTRGRAISTMCGFLNGAYDTTHATSYWLMWQLAKHPQVQTALCEEFARVLGNAPNPSVDDLRTCDYLHAVIQESMRMRATVPVNMRVSDDHDLNIGGYIIPKGTNVNIPNCVMFMDERWFGKDPTQFRPERFMGESDEAERARKSLVVFGEHSRVCVGLTFALAEMKAMVHCIVTRAYIELEDPNDPGEVMHEAGCNQPAVKNKFIFRQRNLGKMREEDNLKWWMTQIDALEKMRPAAANVAHMA